MLHPEQVDGYADRAAAAFDQLNGRILRDMARRILEADYTVTASALWQAQRAKAMGASTSYLIRQFSQLAGGSNKAAKVFAAAMLEADRQDKAGLPPQAAAEAVSLQLSPAAQQIAQSGFRRTMNTLRNLTRTRLLMGNKNMVQTHQAQLGRILDEGHLAVVTGAYSSEQVIRRGLEALAAQGVGACTYPSGHVDTLETVVRRAMVTGINQTAIDISLHNARQLNCRFMELSAHSGARTGDGGPDYTNHSWWQGQIVSLDGEPGYLSLKDIGYGDVRGFGGANCRHNWHLFWPGISTPAYTPEALAEYNAPKIPWQGQLLTEEQARQKQRALERQIRRAKRECIVAEEWGVPSEESAAKARLARARARLNAYLEETGLKMDEGRTEVAKAAKLEPGLPEKSYSFGIGSNQTDFAYINSDQYRAKFNSISENPALNQAIYKYCKAAITHRSGSYKEDLTILRLDGDFVGQTSGKVLYETHYTKSLVETVYSSQPYSLISIHNHGTNVPPSGADFGSAGEKRYAFGIVACYDGNVYYYSAQNARPFATNIIDNIVDTKVKPPYNMGEIDAREFALNQVAHDYGIEWRKR